MSDRSTSIEPAIERPRNFLMSLRVFILSLSVTFGIAWLAVVIVPYCQMREIDPILSKSADGRSLPFIPKRTGRIADGARVYAENGCYLCHTQVVRPTYAGTDLYRSNWAGSSDDEDRGDTRRETNVFDFEGEKYAQVGISRYGADLSNLAIRARKYAGEGSPEEWLYRHLFNPRMIPDRWDSNCPSHEFLFERKPLSGQALEPSLPISADPGTQWVPTAKARALVSYLMSLRKDHPVPAALDFSPAKKDGES